MRYQGPYPERTSTKGGRGGINTAENFRNTESIATVEKKKKKRNKRLSA